MLLELPSELVVSILELLHATDLLRCQTVNHQLHSIIATTTSLTYTIELYSENLVDNPSHSLSMRERLDLLLQRRVIWSNFQPHLNLTHCRQVPVGDRGYYDVKDDVFCLQVNGELQFERPCSNILQLPDMKWSLNVADTGIVMRGFTFDISQDLLVIVEEPQIDPVHANERFRVHCLSLKTGKPHPQASSYQTIFSTGQLIDGWDCTIRIYGTYIGILTQPDTFISTANILYIWDWVNNDMKLVYTGTGYIETFVFLDDHRVMLPVCHEDTPFLRLSVDVLDFLSSQNIHQGEFLCRLWLIPDQDYGDHPITVVTDQTASPLAHNPQLGYPFSWDTEDRLIMIGNAPDHNKELLTVFLYRSHLDFIIRNSPTVEVSWETWTMHIPFISRYTMKYLGFRDVCGSRVILPFHEGTSRGFYLLDFNKKMLRRTSSPFQDDPFYSTMDYNIESTTFCHAQTIYLPEMQSETDVFACYLGESSIIFISQLRPFYSVYSF